MIKYLLVFSCILLFYVEPITAQDNDSIQTQNIREIQVTATAKPSGSLSTIPLQSLSATEMNKIGIQSIGDAVRRFAGVVVKDYGGIGGFKTIAIRGNGAEHTAVLYDGVAMSNVQSGQIDIGQFSLDNVDMLSLAIGQDDNIFRTARSIASVGVLNIITTTPRFDNKNYQAQVNLKGGSWGLFNPYLYYAKKLTDRFSLSVDGSWQRSDGKYSYERQNVNQVETGKRKNSDVDIFRTEINLFGNLSSKQKLFLKGYLFDSERGLPGPIILYSEPTKQRLWDRIYFVQGKYRNELNDRFDLQLLTKFTHSNTKFVNYLAIAQESRYLQNEFYLNGTLLFNLSQDISFSFAEDFSYNTLNANFNNFANPDRYSSLSAFSAKYETADLTIVGNLLGTYITEKVKEGVVPEDRKKLSPAVSVSYQPFQSTNLRLRASYKNIFRVPTFNDLYYVRLGSRNLVPEKTQQYNLGTTWTNSFTDVFNYFVVSGDFFYNTVRDKIVVYPSTFESRMVNLGKVRITGFDLKTSGNLDINEKLNLNFSVNYTYQKAIDITDSEAKNYKDPIPYTPAHAGGASLTIENPWVNIGYSVVMADKSYSSINIEKSKVDGYADHSISLNRSFRVKEFDVRVQADITNIANKTYYIVKDYPMPGRGYYISMNIKF